MTSDDPIRPNRTIPNPCHPCNLWLRAAALTPLLAVLFFSSRALAVIVPTDGAWFRDWQDMGCRMTPGGAGSLGSGVDGAGGNQAHCIPCGGTAGGMPVWWVDEPYLNLWVTDEPLSYSTSSGQPMTFRWTYHQRGQVQEPWRTRELEALQEVFTYGGIPVLTRYTAEYVNVMTNAAWHHNWWQEIVFWDTSKETYTPAAPALTYELNQYYQATNCYMGFTNTFEALLYRGDGGTIYFNSLNSSTPTTSGQIRPQLLGQRSPSDGPKIPYKYSGSSGQVYPYPLTGTFFVTNAAFGFAVAYPDGSQEIYGLVVPHQDLNYEVQQSVPSLRSTAGAYLTQRIDPQGRSTLIGYQAYSNIVTIPLEGTYTNFAGYRVHYVVDPDGRTNTYSYDDPDNTPTRLLAIADPYGRSAQFTPDANYGFDAITDAQTNTSYFAYDGPGRGWLTNLTTPYGSTAFSYLDESISGSTNVYTRRAALVSEPNSAHQLFYYLHAATNLLVTNVTQIPNVPSQVFDAGTNASPAAALNYRNSFYWDRRQFANLSSTLRTALSGSLGSALAGLGQQDARKARLRHWLLGGDAISITESLSSERDPSPDAGGQTEASRTWYSYPGQDAGTPHMEGEVSWPACLAQVLPDGSTAHVCADYMALPVHIFPADWWESYTETNGTLALRTNWYLYAANGVDLVSVSNSLGQCTKLTYNNQHQPTFVTNALGQVTSLNWDSSTFNLKQITLPAGQTATLNYFPPVPASATSCMLSNYALQPQGLNIRISDYTAGLPRSVTLSGPGLPALSVVNIWDGLNRLTSTAYPDATTVSNIYDRLHLGATRDRLGHWTYLNWDALEHLTSITDARSNVTSLSWCDCGALSSITDPLTNITSFFYNNQELLTNVVYGDTSSLTNVFDLNQRLIRQLDGAGRAYTLGYNNQGLLTVVSNAYGMVERIVYDAADRPAQITDENGVTATNSYDLLDRIVRTAYPPGGGAEGFLWATNGLLAYTNQDNQVTWFWRDAAGRLLGVTNANQETTLFTNNALGEITDLVDGRTNHTAWAYNEYGWLTNKAGALNNRLLALAYNPNGQITNRWTPEFGNTTYAFDAVGNLTNIGYPLSAIGYSYDSANQLKTVSDALGTSTFSYTGAGQLWQELGPWTSTEVDYSYKQGLRSTLTVLASQALEQRFAYDSARRLQTVSSPAGTFTYAFNAPRSTLPTLLTLPNGAWITNHLDSLGRFDYTALVNPWGHVLDGYSYSHDALGLRTNILRNNGLTNSSVAITYDNLGQITSWLGREDANGPARLNEQFGFFYDPAHNLKSRTNGLLVQAFNTDTQNQLTNVIRNGFMTASGSLPVPAQNVTVNGLPAQTYGDFTYAAANQTLVDDVATFLVSFQNLHGAGSSTTFSTLPMPATVTLRCDSNGNLTNDGTRSFSYGPENQLTNITVAGQWKSDFVYDGLGRRRIERDFAWQSSNWQLTTELRFIYDGWVLIQIRDTNNNVLATFTRGTDLSGSLHGAGGIGGLLAWTDGGGANYFYHADGAGNITGLMDANLNMAARYLYSPFGGTLGKWGPQADANIMRFSSKPWHAGSGTYDFGFRQYLPNLNRFSSRDPIGEAGGVNLYEFTGNTPLNAVDPYGLDNWYTRLMDSVVSPVTTPLITGPAGLNAANGFDQMADSLAAARGYANGQEFLNDLNRNAVATSGNPGVANAVGQMAKGAAELYLEAGQQLAMAGIVGKGAPAAAQGIADAADQGLVSKVLKKCKFWRRSPKIPGGSAGPHIALGSRFAGVRDFARSIGAEHLLDLPEDVWKQQFLNHVADPSTKFSVSMNGFFGDTTGQMILNEIQSGSNTGWELQKLQEAGRLGGVNFYLNGSPVANPFVK